MCTRSPKLFPKPSAIASFSNVGQTVNPRAIESAREGAHVCALSFRPDRLYLPCWLVLKTICRVSCLSQFCPPRCFSENPSSTSTTVWPCQAGYWSRNESVLNLMKKLAFAFACFYVSLAAQTTETVSFSAVMLPANEVPAISVSASGSASVLVHVVRDAAGKVASGSVDFGVSYIFPGALTITGLHIHSGRAGVNAPVVIDIISVKTSVTDKI